MNRYALSLIALVAGSLVLLAAILLAAPRPEPEKKGPALVAVEIDFNGYGPTNGTYSTIWSFGTSEGFYPNDGMGDARVFWPILSGLHNKQIISYIQDGREIVIYIFNRTDEFDWGIPVYLNNGTVFNALEKASSGANFTFKSEWYPNFRSHRVTEIAGVRDGTDNRYWQYYVNGVYMGTGADLTGLKDGDVVRWEFRSALQ